MDSQTQLQRRQPHLLALRLHAGRDSLNFQRREAGVDWVLATGRGHAGNRHVGVADRLELFEPVARYDLVKRTEILVEQPDQRDGLHAFGQKREAFEVGEQDRRRWLIFRLHFAAFLKLLGNRQGEDIGEQLFRARLLGGQIRMRLIQFPHSLIEFD